MRRPLFRGVGGGLTQVVHLDGALPLTLGASRRYPPFEPLPGREGLMAACTMCPNEIAEPRQIVAPHTLTCSPACAQERDRWRKRQAARRQRQRQKDARAEAREATG